MAYGGRPLRSAVDIASQLLVAPGTSSPTLDQYVNLLENLAVDSYSNIYMQQTDHVCYTTMERPLKGGISSSEASVCRMGTDSGILPSEVNALLTYS